MEEKIKDIKPVSRIRYYFGWLCLMSVIFSVGVITNGMAQDETALRQIIGKKDTRKLNKADRIGAVADKRMDEVSQINRDIQSIQRDASMSERIMKRRITEMETKSGQKIVSTSALYHKSNRLKYGVYKKYLNKFWKSHEAQESIFMNAKVTEEQARDNYSQASVYRRHTRHMNLGLVKTGKLTEANNLESAAIHKQVSSLASCYGIKEPPAMASVPDTTPVLTGKEKPVLPPVEVKPAPDTIKPPPVKKPEPVVMADTKPVPEKHVNIKPTGDQVTFRVQFAASRLPITFEALARIYTGSYPVEAVSEGGWLKYQLIGVPLYSDAQRILKEANAKDAFIVAYRNGIKQNTAEMIKGSRELEKRIQTEGKSAMPEETEYHVEIAVSKSLLKPAEVSKIFKGPELVLLIMEKGLYEYHLNAGYSLENAKSLKERSGIPGAVIVSYKNARRSDLNK